MLRTAIALAAGLASLVLVAPAHAADLPVPAPVYNPAYKAPPAPIVEPAPLWQGFYGGFNAGYGGGSSTVSNAAGAYGSVSPSGPLAGVQLGYDSRFGSFVLGAAADVDYSWMKDTNASAACPSCEVRNHYVATVRGRAGYAIGNWLPYVTGGGALGDIQISTAAGGGQAINKFGWAAGAGVEYGLAGTPWSLDLQYLYTDLGSATCDAGHCGVDTSADLKANLVRAGVNYHF